MLDTFHHDQNDYQYVTNNRKSNRDSYDAVFNRVQTSVQNLTH